MNIQLHKVLRVTINKIQVIDGKDGQFAVRRITVRYVDHDGLEREQDIDLFAERATALVALADTVAELQP